MICEEFREHLDDYMDGLIDESLQARMDTHAEECAACAEALKQAMDIKFALNALEDEIEPPAAVSAAWKRAVRLEAERRRRREMRHSWRTFAALAAALAIWIGATAILDDHGLLQILPKSEETGMAYSSMRYIEQDPEFDSAPETTAVYLASDGEAGQQIRTAPSSEEELAGGAAKPVMRVKTVRTELIAENMDMALANLDDLVSEVDGYYEFEHESEEDGIRSASMTIRVPAEMLDTFMADVKLLGHEVDGEYREENIAQKYYDADAHLKLLEIERDQFAELMAQASDAEELTALAANAESVQLQIDELEAQKRVWDDSVRYAGVNATLRTEPVNEATIGERMAAAWGAALEFGGDMLVSLAYLAPFLLVIGAVCAAVVIAKKKKKNRTE